ncbi:AAA family ATPase [Bacillus toyonensis]|uniref:AAA family ATPase n=1 Tax=Bacillus toyonensis TaxID=155322 RepID=UPI00027BEAA8|nr:AAA family ATPase [Bacillus toyonensis]EJV41776.1 phage nucleotide-binding protein [Bacillus toyonensis]
MEITNGADIKKSETANIIIYSKPGCGKTTVAGLIGGRTLALDIDGTTQVLQGYGNVDIAKIDPLDVHNSILQFYAYAKANIDKYDNIFIDNLTHYQKLWLINRGEKTKSGMPEIKDYALLDNHLLKLIETFNGLNANCIYSAWETTREIRHEDGNQYTQVLPDLRDKIINHLMGIVHVVAQLIKKSDGTRGFTFDGTQTTFAKNHLTANKGCLQEDLLKVLKNE